MSSPEIRKNERQHEELLKSNELTRDSLDELKKSVDSLNKSNDKYSKSLLILTLVLLVVGFTQLITSIINFNQFDEIFRVIWLITVSVYVLGGFIWLTKKYFK